MQLGAKGKSGRGQTGLLDALVSSSLTLPHIPFHYAFAEALVLWGTQGDDYVPPAEPVLSAINPASSQPSAPSPQSATHKTDLNPFAPETNEE